MWFPIPNKPLPDRAGKPSFRQIGELGASLDDSGVLDYLEGRPELDRKL